MSKDVGIAIAAGIGSALVSQIVLTGAPVALLLGFLAPLPLMLVGLSIGSRIARVSVVAGIAALVLLGQPLQAVSFGLLTALPAWMICRQLLLQRPGPGGARDWYPLGAVQAWLSMTAAGLLIGAGLAFGAEAGLEAAIRDYLTTVVAQLGSSLPDEAKTQLIDVLVPFFPGGVATSWALMMAGNAALAQFLLTRAGKSLRPAERLKDLVVPEWASVVLIAAAVLALLAPGDVGYLARNLVIVLMIPFIYQGLAVVHALAARAGSGGMLLAAFYGILVFSFMISAMAAMVVAGIGMVESWWGIRKRMPPPDDKEIE